MTGAKEIRSILFMEEKEKVKVLIVDDNREMRDKLSGLVAETDELALTGMAADGITAIELYEKEHPALVFLDIIMPRMDGFGVLEYLAQQEQRPEVIVISALTQENFIQRALDLGARYYIAKPFDGQM